MKDIVIEIDGVRHKLTKGEVDCHKCSIFGYNCCKVSYVCMAFIEKRERLHFELDKNEK
jgi:hypothetical protein